MRSFERCEGQPVQVTAIALALANQRTDRTMGLAESSSLLYQIIGEVRCHHVARERGSHTRDVEARFLECPGDRRKYEKGCVDGIEQHTLVVLEILVVPARQTLERREQCREVADCARTRAACQLERIRVALLRH